MWVDQMWDSYDRDNDGVLAREEARAFFKVALAQDQQQSSLTQAEYDAIVTPDAATLYVIAG